MSQSGGTNNTRISLRVSSGKKALLMRAAAHENISLTDFVLGHALEAARTETERAEQIQLSKRGSQRMLDLLENPPQPNAKLMAAAEALPDPE